MVKLSIISHHEMMFTDASEAILGVEALRTVIVFVDAQPHRLIAQFARFGDAGVHELRADATTKIFWIDVDSLQLDWIRTGDAIFF